MAERNLTVFWPDNRYTHSKHSYGEKRPCATAEEVKRVQALKIRGN